MYDVAVIGLGPAGVFLAKHLSRSHRVIAIDKKLQNCDGGFHKPCGGLLAPDAQKSLSRFNMSLPKDILVSPQIFSVRTIDVKTGLIRNYQRHYINLDRHRFDQWLIGQIPDYVEVRSGVACTDVMRSNDGFEVTYNENNMSKTIRAKYLVGADGAASIIRRSLFKEFKIHSHLSIQQWFSDSHNTPFYSCVFDSDLTDSYAWGLTKDNYFVFGGAFAKETGKHDFEVLKGKLKAYGFQLDTPLKTEACLVLRPVGPRNYCYGHDGVFFVGEAAGFISPSSLEGISYAIDSGYLLAQCLNNANVNHDPNWEYRKGTRKIRLKLFSKYLKRPIMYNQFSRNLIMKSGLMSIPVVNK